MCIKDKRGAKMKGKEVLFFLLLVLSLLLAGCQENIEPEIIRQEGCPYDITYEENGSCVYSDILNVSGETNLNDLKMVSCSELIEELHNKNVFDSDLEKDCNFNNDSFVFDSYSEEGDNRKGNRE